MITCKTCGASFEKPYHLTKHRQTTHPETCRSRKSTNEPPKPELTGLQQLQSFQSQVEKSIQLAEHERDLLHEKILEYDNTIARYKQMLVRNGH